MENGAILVHQVICIWDGKKLMANGITLVRQKTCQNCEGLPCQTCQDCQVGEGCQTACESTSQAPTAAGSISVVSVGQNSVTLKLSSIPKATGYTVLYRKDPGTSTSEISTTNLTVTISGLDPNTRYAFNYYGYNDYGTGPFTTAVYATTSSLIDPWDWNISNGVATAAQTQKAHQALVNRGPTTDFSYLVWNDMVDKANEIVQARNHTWNTDYGTINETKASSIDKNITARRVNAVWGNMGQFITTGLSKKSPGDTITGQYFIDLANAINDAIPQGV